MLDNDLIKVFLPIINEGLIDRGFNDIVVRQSYQPTQQGADSKGSVYFFKVSDKRYGFLKRKNTWDQINSEEVHEEQEAYETTFQINAWLIQNPADINSITSSDLINVVSEILQSDSTVKTFAQNGIGILRITDITNTYFLDDYNRNEASPSFDFTLTYNRSRLSTIDIIQKVDLNFNKVP